ncbi:MAG: DUF1385 domain-containing protein [Myxococcales bacterium]|nr:DUF1385 domain-containing protein [Myxococcales bacterium]
MGGQAVLEGVMMRAPNAMAVVIRRPSDQHLVVLDQPWRPLWTYAPPMLARWLRRMAYWPITRGALVLVESMLNGLQALSFAAETLEDDNLAPVSTASNKPPGGALFSFWSLMTTGGLGGGVTSRSNTKTPFRAGPFIVSLLAAITLFVAIPHGLAWLISWLIGGHWGTDSLAFHLLDGAIKLLFFIGYVSGIARIPEVHRVFQYHGAEHKVVNAYEQNRPLDIHEVKWQGTFHARCGTSFILLVLTISILVFSLLLPLVPPLSEYSLLNHLALMLIKIPLMLPLGGLAYEINRWAAQHPDKAMVQILVFPGRWMQKLTTREPDHSQLEVALAAIKVVLHRQSLVAHRGTAVRTEYPDLKALEATLSSATNHYDDARQAT